MSELIFGQITVTLVPEPSVGNENKMKIKKVGRGEEKELSFFLPLPFPLPPSFLKALALRVNNRTHHVRHHPQWHKIVNFT